LAKAVGYTSGVALKGKVYDPGGLKAPGSDYAQMQVFNPATNTWTAETESMPQPLSGAAVCANGSKVFVINGIAINQPMSIMQIYDPAQPAGSRWSTGVNPHIGTDTLMSRDGGCAWLGGKLYLFGGDANAGTISGPSDFTWLYDPALGTWADTGFKMARETWLFGYTDDHQFAYVAGGEDPTGKYIRTTEMFDPATGWTKMAQLPTPSGATSGTGLEWPGVGFLNGDLAVFGGFASGTAGAQKRTLVCASPCTSSSSWTNAGLSLVTPRFAFAAITLRGQSPGLVAAGGADALNTMLDSAERTP